MFERMSFLETFENRESFFNRIAALYPTLDPRYRRIEQAYNDAKDAFRDIYRDDEETRYFEHIRAVALIIIEYLRIKDPDIIVAALLHDIVEDIDSWTIQRVRDRYGDRVAFLVEYLTKPDKENFASKQERDDLYHSRFHSAPREFFLIKLPDRFHNLYTLWNCDVEKRKRKISETKQYYLPFAESQLILLHELEAQISILEEELESRGNTDT